MGSEYREALLAAARVCREISETRPYVVNDFTEGIRTGAHRCANAILALAEQEDQRGAAENTRRDESTSAGSTPAQSAPHPDPAGQVSAQAEFGRSAEANLCKQRDAAGNAAPALPGPETVPVPREPTQDWMREFCRRPELDSLDGSEDLQDAVRIILSALAAGSAK